MNILQKLIGFVIFMVGIPVAHGQSTINSILNEIDYVSWSHKEKGEVRNDKDKLALLSRLQKGDTLAYIIYEEEDGSKTYYDFSVKGVYYLDLDFDGDLDLLYSGINGSMRQSGTKIYYNQNDVLMFHSNLRDGIIDIKRNEQSIDVYTQFSPCCGSFTARTDQYSFSAVDTARFVSSVSVTGRIRKLRGGLLAYDQQPIATIEDPILYGLPVDFRGLSPYFRERSKDIRLLIRQKQVVELAQLQGKIKVNILGEGSHRGIAYTLVITAPQRGLLPFPEMLYEWSKGDGRRLIGWVETSLLAID